MTGKVITLVFILILILFSYIAFKASDIKIRKSEKKAFKKPSLSPELAFGPTVYVRNDKEKEKGYQQYEVKKPIYTIGRGLGCDLRIDEPYIAGKQAEIRQRRENGDVFFTLTNLRKENLAEYLDQDQMKYKWMAYKDEVELGEKEVFYLGNIKLLIITPEMRHVVVKSDREILKDKAEAQTLRISTDRSYDEGWDDI